MAVLLIASHASLLRLPYFWDEAGYYVPAARDLLAGSLIPYSTPSNAHPPLVIACVALGWKIFGQSPVLTRCTMLLLAAFSLLGFFRLARAVSNTTVAAAATVLTAVYPVFFAQSSLAQVDLPAAGLTFWGLEAYVRRQRWTMVAWFSLGALAKETAILIPLALFLWEVGSRALKISDERSSVGSVFLMVPALPLAFWYVYHYARTGFVFGNPEFFRYNVQDNLHPLRILLALLLRIWQTVGYLNLYVLTLACLLAMTYPAHRIRLNRSQRNGGFSQDDADTSAMGVDDQRTKDDDFAYRPRIDVGIQYSFHAIAIVYLVTLSFLGGAVLARYMLPITPLFILISVSTVWRRLRAWKAVLAIVAASFIAANFVNPPYGFSPEDNLAYRDYVRLHRRAESFLEERHPHAYVLTAWPASDELSHPYLGYVASPIRVLRIEDFTAEQLLSAADAPSRFDVALVFSTKYHPPHSLFDRWRLWQEWKMKYFGYHIDMTPEAAASILGGELVYVQRLRGQWVGIIEVQRIEQAHVLKEP